MEAQPPPVLDTQLYSQVDALRQELAGLFAVADTTLDYPDKGYIRFRGRLLCEPAECYGELRQRFERHGYTPMVSEEEDGRTAVVALPVVFTHGRTRWIINLVLFLLTIASTLFVGAGYGALTQEQALQIWRGWPLPAASCSSWARTRWVTISPPAVTTSR